MDKKKALRLCGVFAVSNLGQACPSVAQVARSITYTPATARGSAVMFGERYMETNEHENIFASEASGWFRRLLKMSDDALTESHPDLAKLYDGAVTLHLAVS